MKTNRLKALPLFILLVFLSFSACEEPDSTVLPTETQTGKNTFGCYVNKELFVNSDKWGITIGASYTKSTKLIQVYCFNKNRNSISIDVNTFSLNEKFNISKVEYAFSSDSIKLADGSNTFNRNLYLGKNIPVITITKFDTLNHIISGKFEFELKNSEDDTKIIKFTQGRFDAYLSIFE